MRSGNWLPALAEGRARPSAPACLRVAVCLCLSLACPRPTLADQAEDKAAGEKLTLFQLDPVEKGYVRDFQAAPDRVLQVETKALQPPVFEIPGFLTSDECEYIIGQALKEGLHPSGVNDDAYYRSPSTPSDDEQPDPAEEEMDKEGEERNAESVFHDLDINDDLVLDTEELLSVLNTDNAFLRHGDVLRMHRELGLDPDADGRLTLAEFLELVFGDRLPDIEEWVWRQTGRGQNKIRESKQAWLGQPGPAGDPVLAAIQERVVSLTKLPESIIQWSEQLQVVRYEAGGHFHAHYDSNELDNESACMMDGNTGRFCRFMTILYYLDDDVTGGETAFPIADNATYSERATNTEIYDLSDHCHDANLFIKPKKGKAVMWYNHYINQTTGWMGDLNHFSLHGGCEVLTGTKWIANNWIWVDDSYERQVEYLRHMEERTQSGQPPDATEEEPAPHASDGPDMPSERSQGPGPKTCLNGDEL